MAGGILKLVSGGGVEVPGGDASGSVGMVRVSILDAPASGPNPI